MAARILDNPHVVVAAFAADEELIGLVRATFDGLSAAIMGPDANGSPHGG